MHIVLKGGASSPIFPYTFHTAIITMLSHGACNQFYHSQFCICNASLDALWLFTWHSTLKRLQYAAHIAAF